MTSNVPTTMFLRKDVEALARFAHGDLKAHLEKRQADREERSRKIMATREKKQAEALFWRDPPLSSRLLPISFPDLSEPVVISDDEDDFVSDVVESIVFVRKFRDLRG